MLQPAAPDVPPLKLRPMAAADVDQVMVIEADIYEFPWSRGNFFDSLAAGYEAWACEQRGILVAYAVLMWSVDEVHLLNLSVRRSSQRQGFGAAILRWIMADVGARQARRIYLEVRPSNAAARKLYAAHGFGQIGQRKRYYPAAGNTREDALVLQRSLQP